MTLRAVVLPATPLLVPGAAGRAEVLVAVRRAVLDALRALPAHGAPVVVAAGGPGGDLVRGPASASVAAFGVAPAWADPAWSASSPPEEPGVRAASPGAAVALLALAAAGRHGSADVVELGTGVDRAEAAALGRGLRVEGATVVVAHDPRCPALEAVLDGFAAPGDERERTTYPGVDDGPAYDVVRWTTPPVPFCG
ncbi:hypothetical protein [Cellulosimicrobium sp. NPDC057127]|uniref:hypothetical protein n=1 Tax=Cellulosimicrobium sp. NPDC057127 TaxID=3346026 RepID=UPI0036395520